VLVVVGVFAAIHLRAAGSNATRGKAALLRAETRLGNGEIEQARGDLDQAKAAFARSRHELDALGLLLPIGRAIPFVRVQVRGTEAFARAGGRLSTAAIELTNAADAVAHPANPDVPVASALTSLREVHAALERGLRALDASIADVAALNGYRLIGPLASARKDLVTRLPDARQRAARAEAGVQAFLAFAGDDGPRRYLVFSQNPDELRPTGGFLGTYGVLTSSAADGLKIERYDGIENWIGAPEHAAAKVSSVDAPVVFRMVSPPSNQNLSNVNATADWPTGARLAADLWAKGGEPPVDGVLSFTPDFLARMLKVLGPVEVPAFGETVTADNLIERSDFYTHQEPPDPGVAGGRKRFVSEVVRIVLGRLLDAPASTWRELARAAAQGFDAREAMAWSKESTVQPVLAGLAWDGAFRGADGDFAASSEFEFAAKNGRGLRRTFDHHVVLHADGSARVTTDVTIANTKPFDPSYNLDSLSYVVAYGPRGGALADGTDEVDASEPLLDDHPSAAWLMAAPPLDQDKRRAVWDVPSLASRQKDGSFVYQLTWRSIPAHTGDVVNLRVDLPEGWRWEHAPPATLPTTGDFVRSFRYIRKN
jgi:hypothetical protein